MEPIGFNSLEPCLLGIDLGGSGLKGGLLTLQGERIWTQQMPSNLHSDPGGIMDRITELALRLRMESAARNFKAAALGLSSTLDVDPDLGRFLPAHYPYLKIWDDFSIASGLQERGGLPVVVENDGPAAAWGEYRLGAGKGCHSLVMVTLGSGVGGGAVLEGRRLSKTLGRAAYFGHMCVDLDGPSCPCGRHGCWELYASASALEQRATEARELTTQPTRLGDTPSGEEIVSAARQGDQLACQLLEEHSAYLGVGLVDLANVFNPGLIVIGGGLSLAGELLLEPARRILQAQRLPLGSELKLVSARFPTDAGWIGAGLLAWEKFGGEYDSIESDG